MANLKNVIYLSNEDYATLVNTGTVTIDGTTLTYDENNLYITPDLADAGMQNPMTTAGDLIVGGTNGLPTRLAKGSNGQALVINNGNVAWQTVGSGDGTVTSVQVQATSPVVSSQNTAQSVSLNTTISLADAYGDTKNPYGSKTKNYVLAAPSTTSGTPSFRALVASDIPALSYQTDTSTHAGGTAVTLNNQSKASSSASFYAPTSGGTTNTILVGKGTTTAPEWSSSTTWSGAAGALVTDSSGVISVNTTNYTETVIYSVRPLNNWDYTFPCALQVTSTGKTYQDILTDLSNKKRVILRGTAWGLGGTTELYDFVYKGYCDTGDTDLEFNPLAWHYFVLDNWLTIALDCGGGPGNLNKYGINAPLVAYYTYDTTISQYSTNAVQNKVVYTALQGKESTTNKTTSISNASTDTEYPSAKAVYDALENKDSHYEFNSANGVTGTLTLVGDDVDKALRSPVPVYLGGGYKGEGVIFWRELFDDYLYVLFPDATQVLVNDVATWVNGAYFTYSGDVISTSTTFTFVNWSSPNSIAITNEKINALDVSDITANLSADKTITALSETNGLISASASQIAIKSDQTTKATTNVTIATNDVLPVFDNSDSNKLKGSISFDTTTSGTFLNRNGTWTTPVVIYTKSLMSGTGYTGTWPSITMLQEGSRNDTFDDSTTIMQVITDLNNHKLVVIQINVLNSNDKYYFMPIGGTNRTSSTSTYHDDTYYFICSRGGAGGAYIAEIHHDPDEIEEATYFKILNYRRFLNLANSMSTPNSIVKFSSAWGEVTSGPTFGNSTTTFLRNDGTWAEPVGTAVTFVDWS